MTVVSPVPSDLHRDRVAQLVAAHGPDVARLCEACVAGLPGVAGAGLAVMTSLPTQQVRYVSNTISARVEELQLTLGEGPCRDAFSRREPVLVTDLDDAFWTRRWPVFAPAAVLAGVRALFALPLRAGAVCLGVIDLYRPGPGALVGVDLDEALAFADAATDLLLAEHLPGGEVPGTDRLFAHRAAVHQATGMVSAQLRLPIAEAFLRLRAHAYAVDRSLDEVADDVVSRKLRFEADNFEADNDDKTR